MNEPVEIRAYRPGDEVGLTAGYNKVFLGAGQAKARSLEHWRWKFRDNPTGLMHITVADHEEHGIIGESDSGPEK